MLEKCEFLVLSICSALPLKARGTWVVGGSFNNEKVNLARRLEYMCENRGK